jgi:hypothetical protein
MSDWAIRSPYRSRDDDRADVALASSELEESEERAVAYQLAIDAATHGGMRSVDELHDRIA